MPDRNPEDVEIEGRLVGNGLWVTESIRIPAMEAATTRRLYGYLCSHSGLQMIDGGFFKTLYRRRDSQFEPIFVLQETAAGARHSDKHTSFHIATRDNDQEIVRFFHRNVLKGEATKLRVEVHIGWEDQVDLLLPRSPDMDPQEAWKDYYDRLWRAGRGKGDLGRDRFGRQVAKWTDDGQNYYLDDLVSAETTVQWIPRPEPVAFMPGSEVCEFSRAATDRGATRAAAIGRAPGAPTGQGTTVDLAFRPTQHQA
ncbi:hypothetical protein CLCR_10723 [Cladophialophora carrionii]|uniref:Uncharacterized protein n=1 Tax=Cladophialophora carrionii TaxID=86049 RepID=A0A1C1CZP1_9EURO|nr:hypothetical protein CLCR_10723 [Cladophialophora carrionii]